MDNHYHLLIQNIRKTLSKGMHWFNGMYAQYFNKKYTRNGHLFQGRFGDTLVQSGEHVSVVSQYIALNPVRKELVTNPSDWAWSSYLATIGQAEPHGCLDVSGALEEFGGDNELGRQNYRQYILGGIGQESVDIFVPIFGDKEFIKEQLVGVQDKSLLRLARPKLSELVKITSKWDRENCVTRNAGIIEAVNIFGYKQSEVAKFLNLDKSQVCKIVGS